MEDPERVKELLEQGLHCSQILVMMALELQGKTNPDLVRAMNSLAGGIGFTGETCGVLSGAACAIGLYAGRGSAEEEENLKLKFMLEDLVRWFKRQYGQAYGGIRCAEIVGENGQFAATRCPAMIQGAVQEVKELLVENGFDLSGDTL